MKVWTSFRTARTVAILALFAVLAIMGTAARADAYPPLKPGIVKVDTGTLQEDEQPRWTARLAAHGWDYNPACDRQGARFDWFAPGQPCNSRDLPGVRVVGAVA